jgi:hypothetical protein
MSGAVRVLVVAAAVSSCGRIGFSAVGGDAAIDAGGAGSATFPYLVAAELIPDGSNGPAIVTIPMGASGFASGCGAIPVSAPPVYMVAHPSLPGVVYGIDFDLTTYFVGCTSLGSTNAGVKGVSAAIPAPRIAFDAVNDEMFFAVAGSNSLYRAAISPSGVASLLDSTNNALAGPVTLDPQAGLVAMISPGAPGTLYAYELGAADDFRGSAITAGGGCNVPRDLVVSGGYIVELCHQAVMRHPLNNGTIGSGELMTNTSVDVSVALGSGLYLIANDTPVVQLMTLDSGMPTFIGGLTASPFTALAAIPDGTIAVGATAVTGLGPKLVEWQIAGTSLVQIAELALPAQATALAITAAP